MSPCASNKEHALNVCMEQRESGQNWYRSGWMDSNWSLLTELFFALKGDTSSSRSIMALRCVYVAPKISKSIFPFLNVWLFLPFYCKLSRGDFYISTLYLNCIFHFSFCVRHFLFLYFPFPVVSTLARHFYFNFNLSLEFMCTKSNLLLLFVWLWVVLNFKLFLITLLKFLNIHYGPDPMVDSTFTQLN